jgi:hypothetical protein
MTHAAIPSWTAAGILPPTNPADPAGRDRSPYRVSLADVVLRFANTLDRCRILQGLLHLRATLHEVRLDQGFQWLDGSFFENVEELEARTPRDVDVVTFVEFSAGFTITEDLQHVLDHVRFKAEYLVDHYFVELNLPSRELVTWSTYWYCVWSHRRTQQWRGFLQIDLEPSEDELARLLLATTRGRLEDR